MNFPLENLLDSVQKDPNAAFPDTASYFSRYQTALGKLRSGPYRTTNVGLALLSSPQGLYTDHGPEHFDEVVRYLGEIIPSDEVKPNGAVAPYELFIILVAARIHDVGNNEGRANHEQRCYKVLKDIGDGSDRVERLLIAGIAQAHGGSSTRGCKDTIGDLSSSSGVFSVSVNARKCAALVRIADEICENRKRAFEGFDFTNEKIKNNELHHVYAWCISRNSFSSLDRHLTIEFDIPFVMLDRRFTIIVHDKPTETLLIEEIARRLEKLDLERRYCNTYLPESLRIRGIKVIIRVYEDKNSSDEISFRAVEITHYDFQDIGYPIASEKLITRWPDLAPDRFASLVSDKTGSRKASVPIKRSLFSFLKGRK